jgi:hypothetical protein
MRSSHHRTNSERAHYIAAGQAVALPTEFVDGAALQSERAALRLPPRTKALRWIHN